MEDKRVQETPDKKLENKHSKFKAQGIGRSESIDPTTKTKSKLKTMEELIKIIEQKSLKAFQRTQDENDGSRHKEHVCIICDCFVFGNDPICHFSWGGHKET